MLYELVQIFGHFWTKITPRMPANCPQKDKNSKFPDFQRFYAIFVQFSIDFVDWNVKNNQRG